MRINQTEVIRIFGEADHNRDHMIDPKERQAANSSFLQEVFNHQRSCTLCLQDEDLELWEYLTLVGKITRQNLFTQEEVRKAFKTHSREMKEFKENFGPVYVPKYQKNFSSYLKKIRELNEKVEKAKSAYAAGNYYQAIKIVDPIFKDALRRGLAQELSPRVLKLYFPLPKEYLNLVTKYLPEEIRTLSAEEQVKFILYLFALIRQESVFNPYAASPAGALGLMQIMPSTASSLNQILKINSYHLFNPEDNLRLGSFYFAQLLFEYNSGFRHISSAIASYNLGPSKIAKLRASRKRWSDALKKYNETSKFTRQVKFYFSFYQKMYEEEVKSNLYPSLLAAKEKSKSSYYYVIAAKVSNYRQAKAIGKQLKRLGFDYFLKKGKEGEIYVQVSANRSLLFAQENLRRLKESGFSKAFVLKSP